MLKIELLDLIIMAMVHSLGPVFFFVQNRTKARGGGISLVKAFWLVYVISLWYVFPVLLAFKALNQIEVLCLYLFLGSVGLRAIIEIILCYITHNWRVLYGVLFNIIHLLIALTSIALFIIADSQLLFAFTFLAICILTELVFVRWFIKSTGGPEQGYYFVPDLPEYAWVHRCSLMLFVPQFILFWAWMFFAYWN